ncbi:hypothetical protein DL96DRAFT_1577334 [Flagelloscypha sp. PMI_526]|nr:hypothetical protein DL96DRAFT_1577334 [Flagelloscypha sp. PMI_526]
MNESLSDLVTHSATPEPVLSAAPGNTRPEQSPAPEEQQNELLSNRLDLASRERLSVSRGPVFLPFGEAASDYFLTDTIGVNHLGFRYTPAGLNPPGYATLCRTIESNPTNYRIAWEDRSPFVGVSKDGLRLCGGKGFRSARGNAPVREGKWYLEVTVLRAGGELMPGSTSKEGGYVRLGWGRREAPLNGPAGLDGYSYGYRDKTGEKVTLSRPRPYGRPYKSGDVIGMYISLPPRKPPPKDDPLHPAHLNRERIAIDLKGQETFEIREYVQSKEMIALMDYSGKSTTSVSLPSSSTTKKSAAGKGLPERGPPQKAKPVNELRPLPTLPGSCMAFFVNGQSQGVAFQDVYDFIPLRSNAKERKKPARKTKDAVHRENPFDDGTLGYYPFISLFNGASVELNPGPNFAFPPPPDIDATLLAPDQNEPRYPEFMKEQWALDEIEESEAKKNQAVLEAERRVEAEKKALKEKKKQQTDARKKAKKDMQLPPQTEMMSQDDISPSPQPHSASEHSPSSTPGPSYIPGRPYTPGMAAQPSPLRRVSLAWEDTTDSVMEAPINPEATPAGLHEHYVAQHSAEMPFQEEDPPAWPIGGSPAFYSLPDSPTSDI